ncbi:APC family permease [Rhizobium sp. C4]|uniref:APC family permease n=1 Tax=Rhizobium sp. C4 TaxID=1349800 RepID=UPI001E392C13|nr:APC family permease [Rhizobium sp. C4]MCD2173593.1 APC family permease [Rhizobium sp. C4]
MTTPVTETTRIREGAQARGHLARGRLSLPEVIAQSIGTVAPSGTPALVIPVVFAVAGNATWVAYLFATIALLFVSWNINQFARRTANPGALYVFAGQGLGGFWGVIAGWSLLIAYLFTAGAVIGGSVNSLLVLVHTFGIAGADRLLTIVISLAVILGAWWIAYRDIVLSTRAILAIELATVVLILIVVIGSILTVGPVVDPAQTHFDGVSADTLRLGLVLAFFSFVGFESATTLGSEAKSPYQSIPRAVIISVVSIGLLFVISSYGLTKAFHGLPVSLDKAEAPLTTAAGQLGISFVGSLIDLGVALSFFACTLGSLNAGGRVLFALSRHGLFHKSASSAHAVNATPHVAVTILAIIAAFLSLALTQSGYGLLDTFGLLGTIATYGFLFAYILVAAGTMFFLKRIGVLKPWHVLVSVITVLLLLIPLIGSIYPVPAWPFSILPYIFLALLALGVAWFVFIKTTAPQELAALEADLLATDGEVQK